MASNVSQDPQRDQQLQNPMTAHSASTNRMYAGYSAPNSNMLAPVGLPQAPQNQGLQPTFNGFVSSTQDAILLFQACLNGVLQQVSRRPHDRERSFLIKSGSIFIFNEGSSGIKRWTDGIAWSPSRILGNFLVYRELEKPFAPGEKKRATRRRRAKKKGEPYHMSDAPDVMEHREMQVAAAAAASASSNPSLRPNERGPGGDVDAERALVGSLVDSYGFKEGGLIKKTLSVTINDVHHHLVSYYRPEDVVNGSLKCPSDFPYLKELHISPELTQRQNFRIPPDGSAGIERVVIPQSGGQSQSHGHSGMYQGAAAPYGEGYGKNFFGGASNSIVGPGGYHQPTAPVQQPYAGYMSQGGAVAPNMYGNIKPDYYGSGTEYAGQSYGAAAGGAGAGGGGWYDAGHHDGAGGHLSQISPAQQSEYLRQQQNRRGSSVHNGMPQQPPYGGQAPQQQPPNLQRGQALPQPGPAQQPGGQGSNSQYERYQPGSGGAQYGGGNTYNAGRSGEYPNSGQPGGYQYSYGGSAGGGNASSGVGSNAAAGNANSSGGDGGSRPSTSEEGNWRGNWNGPGSANGSMPPQPPTGAQRGAPGFEGAGPASGSQQPSGSGEMGEWWNQSKPAAQAAAPTARGS
ncbi:hypothetical protein CANCADRAFT_104830 [Tortispora caseinolytica NRRL Y-17796]|uniref:Gti1/Pac2 family protein n=1 Tax=Tortispora caseinolytica NRRL Y-17796 TaxID=767744 RepID=A0A1E4TEV5_9ASCO|nr:hypothetical protein CANCADRAFT_104830 [Tortispora caseinolytica NRRL Y-17796]